MEDRPLDSNAREIQLIHEWDMTHSDMRHDPFLDIRVENSHRYSGHVRDESCLTRVRESCVRHKWMRHGSFRHETWLVHTWDMTHSHTFVSRVSNTNGCDMAHSDMRHDSFTHGTWLIHIHLWVVCQTHMRVDSFTPLIHTTRIWMSRFSYLNESCLSCECLRESHVSRAYISTWDMTLHTYGRVTSHTHIYLCETGLFTQMHISHVSHTNARHDSPSMGGFMSLTHIYVRERWLFISHAYISMRKRGLFKKCKYVMSYITMGNTIFYIWWCVMSLTQSKTPRHVSRAV